MEPRRPPSRRTILRRRAVAVGATAAATALVWLLLLHGGEPRDDAPPSLTPAELSPQTRELLAGLSAEQKLAQLVLGGLDPSSSEPPGGGVLIDAGAWPGADGGRALTDALHAQVAGDGVPPLIAIRQEGGAYRELADLPPSEREIELGDRGDPQRTERWAEETARALKDLGFDLDLAPVADVATLDSPIADRSFSDDAAVAAAMTAAAMRGCRRGGLACAPSHFPGLGAASQDTDSGPATVGFDRATLLHRDLAPFVAAFRRGAPAVVVSHAFYAAYDAVTPASQSPAVLDGLLRGRLGFEGAAITDDLEAGAIRAGNRVPEAAVTAIAAGADMVQVSDPTAVGPTLRALRAAVGEGTISDQRLDAAAGRVLELKRRLGLLG